MSEPETSEDRAPTPEECSEEMLHWMNIGRNRWGGGFDNKWQKIAKITQKWPKMPQHELKIAKKWLHKWSK